MLHAGLTRKVWYLGLCVALTPITPTYAQHNSNENAPPIVVTARSLNDSEKRLKDCLARQCPPNEDIHASLSHAENLFIAGDYRNARNVIGKSIKRNHNNAKHYPVDVADLYSGGAAIQQHSGEPSGYMRMTIASRDALKAGLPANDPRIFLSQLAVGDMRAQLGSYDAAGRYYREVWREAEKLSLKNVVARARLRDAFLSSLQGETGSAYAPYYRAEARRKFQSILADYDTDHSSMALVARLALARLDDKEGSSEAIKAIIARYGQVGKSSDRPTLLFAPSVIDAKGNARRARAEMSGSVPVNAGTMNLDDVWADIGFWVRPDGTTNDIEILRNRGSKEWLKPVMTAIQGRRYSRTNADPADPGFFMLERYTLAAPRDPLTGSRIRTRGLYGKIERLDLTVEPPN